MPVHLISRILNLDFLEFFHFFHFSAPHLSIFLACVGTSPSFVVCIVSSSFVPPPVQRPARCFAIAIRATGTGIHCLRRWVRYDYKEFQTLSTIQTPPALQLELSRTSSNSLHRRELYRRSLCILLYFVKHAEYQSTHHGCA